MVCTVNLTENYGESTRSWEVVNKYCCMGWRGSFQLSESMDTRFTKFQSKIIKVEITTLH